MIIGVVRGVQPGRDDGWRPRRRRWSSSVSSATRSWSSRARGPGVELPGRGLRRGRRDHRRRAGRPTSCSASTRRPTDELDRLQAGRDAGRAARAGAEPRPAWRTLAQRPITALAMDAVPRISRAQSLDVLSSMANIAGYRAVVEAAHEFGRFFTGQVTAAGKVPPAKVLVAGPGWPASRRSARPARWARSCGPPTRGRRSPTRSSRWAGSTCRSSRREVEVSATGYAKEMGDDYNAREAQLYAEQCRDVDIIITTALIPGRPGAAADHRGDGGVDEARHRDRRHGRGERRQRRGHGGGRGGRHRQRRHDHRLHRPGGPAARAGLASCTAPTWST